MNPDETRLPVAIVGCGGIARAHARGYAEHPKAQLVAFHDTHPERSGAFADEYGGTACASLEELLSLEPALVSVSTPPGSHADVAVAALRSGASVLVEKPVTTSLADMDRIAEAEASSAGKAYVVLQHRHGSAGVRARRLMRDGALGRPLVGLCETLWYRPDSYFDLEWRGHWRGEGGGPTLGHGIHQIDLLLELMGEWVSVDARSFRLGRPVEFEDSSLGVVRFAGGAVASIVTSLLSPREVSRIRVDTDAGTLDVEHVYGYRDSDWTWTPVPSAADAARLGRDPGLGLQEGSAGAGAADAWTADPGAEVPSNHIAQIRVLVDDLLAGRPHETTLASARATMELITAIYASSFEGRPVSRDEVTPASAYYHGLHGGLSPQAVDARLR